MSIPAKKIIKYLPKLRFYDDAWQTAASKTLIEFAFLDVIGWILDWSFLWGFFRVLVFLSKHNVKIDVILLSMSPKNPPHLSIDIL